MPASDASGDKAPPPQPGQDAGYRQYIAETLFQHVTKGETIDPVEAYRQVVAVTGRTYGTVKNWLYYRTNLPDLESLARIVLHWRIAPDVLFPPNSAVLLRTAAKPELADGSAVSPSRDQLLISLYGTPNHSNVDKALGKYTDHPKATVFVRQQGGDMNDQIRPGELMLIDAAVEQLQGSGLYLLRFSEGKVDTTCVRIVEILAGQQAVRLSCANPLMSSSTETVPLTDGRLPDRITVLGRVAAVLKQP